MNEIESNNMRDISSNNLNKGVADINKRQVQ